jgi:membrane associated rhomboid family serine protease
MFLPLRDRLPTRTFPFINYLLIVANVLVFLYELTLGRAVNDFTLYFGLVPAAFSWVAVFTSMFLHGGLFHVAGNMLYLWIFGDNVEDRLGHGRFIVFYFLCGIAAALGQVWMDPTSTLPTIGASGAIAGVMGAYFVLFPKSRVLTLIPLIIFWEIIELPAIFLLGFWFLLQLVSAGSLTGAANAGGGGVAFAAHVAGFIAGLIGVFVFRKREVNAWDYGR